MYKNFYSLFIIIYLISFSACVKNLDLNAKKHNHKNKNSKYHISSCQKIGMAGLTLLSLCKAQSLTPFISNENDINKHRRRLQTLGPTIMTDLNGSMCQFEFYNLTTISVTPNLILDGENPIIAYEDNSANLFLIKCFDAICSNFSNNFIDNNFLGDFNFFSLNLNKLGFPVMSYPISNSDLNSGVCLDPLCGTVFINNLKNFINPTPSSIQINKNNNPIILVSDISTFNMLFLINCDDPLCVSYNENILFNDVDFFTPQSFLLYNDTLPVFVYTMGNNELIYNFCQDITCQTINQTIIGGDLRFGKIKFNKYSNPVILSTNFVSRDLLLTICFDIFCTNSTTINLMIQTFVFNFELADNINPVILYNPISNISNTQILYCFTSDCSLSNNTFLTNGRFPSISLNQNNPVIAFNDNSILKLGVCMPIIAPTLTPSMSPNSPSMSPTISPSKSPSLSPSSSPSLSPTQNPSNSPSMSPTISPSKSPSQSPSLSPSLSPTLNPSNSPSMSPTISPSKSPSQSPSLSPSLSPTQNPSISPSLSPTKNPSNSPSMSPTISPSQSPSQSPSLSPSLSPTLNPSNSPSVSPSMSPSSSPTNNPSLSPSPSPSSSPSDNPSNSPSTSPSQNPSISPTQSPSDFPTPNPTDNPSKNPTFNPSSSPSPSPTNSPTPEFDTNFSPGGFVAVVVLLIVLALILGIAFWCNSTNNYNRL